MSIASQSRRRLPSFLTFTASLAFLVACNGDDDGNGAVTPGPEETATIAASPTATPANGASPTAEQVASEVSAENNQFNVETITVPAGAQVEMPFTNNDRVPHNVAIYETDDAQEEIFVGEVFTGPDETRTYEFEAPSEPGNYFFRCDVHPVEMTGTFVVE